MMQETAAARPARIQRSLARAIARRCVGRTLVVGQDAPDLLERLEARGLAAQGVRAPEDTDERFDTVVVLRSLEYVESGRSLDWLQRAWGGVSPRGRLLVCVPNEDHADDPDRVQRFDRRSLKKLLKKIDHCKTFTDQPFGWLLMSIDADAVLDRPANERCRVIARLCRGDVLELGCGPGHLCRKIADRGLTVVGVDKSAAKIAKASRLFPDIAFEQADILELDPERQYDTVLLSEVLEHVPEDEGDRMLEIAWKAVAPGGRLIVSVPNEDCIRHPNHLREFAHDDLAALLRRHGAPNTVREQPFRWLLMYVDQDD